MIAYLKSEKLTTPRAVASAPTGDVKNVGFVSPSFKVGTIFLKNVKKEYIRLEWGARKGSNSSKNKQGDAIDRRRALPAGTYTLTGYRIVRKDEAGKEWFISATSGHGIRKIQVLSGKVSRVTLDDAIMVTCRAQPKRGVLRIQMAIQGEHHSGLSIYRDAKRIPIRYAVRNRQGKTLTSGAMEYG